MDMIQQIEEILSNKDDFRIQDILKLFTQLSHLHSFQGRVLSQLLKMTSSLIQVYNEEVILSKNIQTQPKNQTQFTTEQKIIDLNQPPEITSINKTNSKLDTIMTNEIGLTRVITDMIQNSITLSEQTYQNTISEEPLNQILRLDCFKGNVFQEAFKKKFKKVKQDTTHRSKNCKLDSKLSNEQKRSKSKIKEEKIWQFQGVPQDSDTNIRMFKQTVRNKQQRKQLTGHLCEDCESFLQGLNVSDDEIKTWCKECSRHRGWNNVIHQDLDLFPSQIGT